MTSKKQILLSKYRLWGSLVFVKNSHNYSDVLNYMYHEKLEATEKTCIERKHENNVPFIKNLIFKYISEENHSLRRALWQKLEFEITKLPNSTHPGIINFGNTPRETMSYASNSPDNHDNIEHEFSKVCKYLNIMRMDHLRNFTGHKSYYLMGSLAEMEQAVIQYTLSFLKSKRFKLVAVPDILQQEIINSCGMQTDGERTQVYKLDSEKCLSGTAEMALAGCFKSKTYEEKDLPLTVAAVSRCYRAETSKLHEEKGIYRVHNFSKVEMFSICTEEQSQDLLELFKETEISLFKNLNMTFKVLEMPPSELGDPAYQKYDIEAWMPARKQWGEISSCSNCTDYQSKRLNIRYRTDTGQIKFVHTVNGTAAAIPRLLIALIESNQTNKDIVISPSILKSYMKTEFKNCKAMLPETKFVKSVKPSV